MRNAAEQKYLAAYNLGNYPEALSSYKLFNALKDSMQNEEHRRISLAKEFAFKEEKLKLENVGLQTESQVRGDELHRARYYLVALILLTTAIGGLAFTNYRSLVRNKKLAAQVQEQNEEIQTQSEELSQANEEIRGINETLETQVKIKTSQIVNYAYYNAHQVRGPLARIIGLTNLIRDKLIKETEMETILNMITLSAQELDQVVTDINQVLKEQEAQKNRDINRTQ